MGYPSQSLPSGFDQNDIVVLNLRFSHLTLSEEMSFPKLVHLTRMDFVGCPLITHFPNVSGVPNLNKLDHSHCSNLIAIHHSVGFLQKLERLAASFCGKLQDFPPRMSSPSLQYLDLSSTSIAFFPHIEESMCAPLIINVYGCPIKELPDSIGNLVGLQTIHINSKNVSVRALPTELFMLPNLLMLDLCNCGVVVRESLKRLLNIHAMGTTGRSTFNKPRFSPLRVLHCCNCGLTDEDLNIILSCFPNLVELVISGNEFVSLPASIKESANLGFLDVTDCLMLEEIPELPKSIVQVYAQGCPCLSSEAFKMLWSQAFNEVNGLEVVMPSLTEIPDWFDHHCKGGIVSFQARPKFPVLVIASILEEHAWLESIHLHINGDLGKSSYYPCHNRNASMFDLRRLFRDLDWSSLETFLVREWNRVEIEIECHCKCYYDRRRCNINNCNVRSCGVYVYKKKSSMEDIRFTCPNSLNRTLSIVDDDSPQSKYSEEAQA